MTSISSAAASPSTNIVIRASAGSGKTFQLSNRYIQLLLAGVPTEQILATTFTRKAAGEILDRILLRLGRAAVNDQKCQELSTQIFKQADILSLKELRSRLIQVVHNLNRIRVCTLDSFFKTIVDKFSLELGFPTGWQMIDQIKQEQILREGIFSSFHQSQVDIANQLLGMLFKGETERAISNQLFSLANNLFPVWKQTNEQAWHQVERPKVLDSDFLLQAKEELMKALLPQKKEKTTKKGSAAAGSTFEVVSSNNPRPLYVKAKYKLLEIVDKEDWPEFFKQTIVGKVLDSQSQQECVYDHCNIMKEAPSFYSAIKKICEYGRTIELNRFANQTEATWKTLARINETVTQLKRLEGAYYFDDITNALSSSLLAQRSGQLVFRLDSEIRYMLLDEFQDTSFVQWSILAPFAEQIIKQQKMSLFCVGDLKQSIYGWRGALPGIFQSIADRGGISNLKLAESRRSCPTVIQTVNKVFSSLENNSLMLKMKPEDTIYRQAALKWKERFEEHLVAPVEKLLRLSGYASLETAPLYIKKEAGESNNTDSTIDEVSLRTDVSPFPNDGISLNENLDEDINENLDEDINEDFNEDLDEDSKMTPQRQMILNYAVKRVVEIHRNSPDSTIGILVRSNAPVPRLIASLRRRGLLVSQEGGVPLTDSAAVEAILSILAVGDHPGNTIALFHLASIPALSDFFDINSDNYNQVDIGEKISLWIREHLVTYGLVTLVSEMGNILIDSCDLQEKERLERLLELACQFEQQQEIRLDPFIELVRQTKLESPAAAKIRVMTIHGAKGLEFDVVVLPELWAKLEGQAVQKKIVTHRPSSQEPIDIVLRYINKEERKLLSDKLSDCFDRTKQFEIEETFSLLYVALTRAVRQILMIIPPESAGKTIGNLLKSALDLSASNEEESETESVPKPTTGPKILYELGDPQWWRPDQKCQTVSPVPEEKTDFRSSSFFSTSAISFQFRGKDKMDQYFRTRQVDIHSPSFISRRQWQNTDFFERGNALHLCFEKITWLDQDGIPDRTLLQKLLKSFIFEQENIDKYLDSFAQICRQSKIQQLLSLSEYRKEGATAVHLRSEIASPSWQVYRERPFTYMRTSEIRIRGTIDRLVLLYDGPNVVGADIIDYKTNIVPEWYDNDETTSSLCEKELREKELRDEYGHQIKEYRNIVARWYHLKPKQITSRLVFVSHEKILNL